MSVQVTYDVNDRVVEKLKDMLHIQSDTSITYSEFFNAINGKKLDGEMFVAFKNTYELVTDQTHNFEIIFWYNSEGVTEESGTLISTKNNQFTLGGDDLNSFELTSEIEESDELYANAINDYLVEVLLPEVVTDNINLKFKPVIVKTTMNGRIREVNYTPVEGIYIANLFKNVEQEQQTE